MGQDVILGDTGWEFGESFVSAQSFHFVILTLAQSLFATFRRHKKNPSPMKKMSMIWRPNF